MLTADRLREVLKYNRRTGVFTWRVALSFRVRVGTVAGTPKGNGYLVIRIDGTLYLAHRLAWLYETGVWPGHDIDHHKGPRALNGIARLRDVPRRLNNENRRGVKGYTQLPDGRYKAQIKTYGKNHSLGVFSTAQSARRAYLKAKRELHEGCTQ